MCFSVCAAVSEWKTMALGFIGIDIRGRSSAQLRCDRVGTAAGTWSIVGAAGPEGGGVIFALAESHFEKDAAFQDLFI